MGRRGESDRESADEDEIVGLAAASFQFFFFFFNIPTFYWDRSLASPRIDSQGIYLTRMRR